MKFQRRGFEKMNESKPGHKKGSTRFLQNFNMLLSVDIFLIFENIFNQCDHHTQCHIL